MKKRMVLTLLFACVLLTALSANAQTETPSAQKKVEIRIAHDNAVTPGIKHSLNSRKWLRQPQTAEFPLPFSQVDKWDRSLMLLK